MANGYTDYLTVLSERDGGINGVKIKHVDCETGYNTKKGVECYEKVKNTPPSGALISPVHGYYYQLIPKAAVDGSDLFHGLRQDVRGQRQLFPWVFNFPATYWSQATALVDTSLIRKAVSMH